jgi:hypothetical protein
MPHRGNDATRSVLKEVLGCVASSHADRRRRWSSASSLLAALSGTAIALPGVNLIDSGDIKNGQVKNKDIAKNAVTGRKVKNGSLSGADVKDGSLTPTDFSGSVQGPKGDKGDTGDTGARGPSDGFSVGNGTSAGSDTPLNLAVPAGDYFVTAKVVLFTPPGNTTTRCDLTGGTGHDASFGSLEATGHTQETMLSTMVTHFAAPGNINWSCNTGTADQGEAVINAVQVGALH